MVINVTSRHFKAHDELVSFAKDTIEKLLKFYDGILKADVVLHFEKERNSVKYANVTLSVNGTLLKGEAHSDDFRKSIDLSVEKLEIQLKKYKDKMRRKTKIARRLAAKTNV